MTQLRVWAPGARTVEVQCSGTRAPMTRTDGGWWSVELRDAAPGSDYSFMLEGGAPLPDPRSAWQPFGVHGPSRIVDHSAFRWSDRGWSAPELASGVIYELHIGTFTPAGTFDAAIDRLGHLVDLGATHVELMPVAEFPGDRGWGYDGVDLFAPHHDYGGPDGLKRLVDACHARGLAVILDVVYNHFGPSGNYLPRFGPYLTDRHSTPWGDAVNLDGEGSDEVRRFFCDNAKMWLRDYHFDGLRLDAVHAIIDTSALHFLEQLAGEVHQLGAELGRHLLVVAESDLNDPRLIRPIELGGYGLDALWCDDFHHALHAMLTAERSGYYIDFGRLTDLATALRHGFVYEGRYSAYRGHRHGRSAKGIPGDRFIGFTQNHDQVGNRAKGERTSHLASIARLKIGAAFLLTAPLVPLIFQGEEWGASTPFQYFTGHEDAELARAVSAGRRREFARFGWRPEEIPDPQARETFERSKLRWEELGREPHRGLLDWYRRLIRLRKAVPELRDGCFDRVRTQFDEDARWLVIERAPIVMAANLSDASQTIPIPPDSPTRVVMESAQVVLASREAIELPAHSIAILAADEAAHALQDD
jgi:maltooligosyltrehalose trehalohydrolase